MICTARRRTVAPPGHTPAHHGVGIVHLRLGAFHRAYQVAMTDAAGGAAGGD
ncbi:MAG: fructuronate reductase [Paracoccaceae bacterium]|jgi:fructuronate reductase